MSTKDTQQYLRTLAARGYRLTLASSGHTKVWDGPHLVTVAAGTSSSASGTRNLKATVARWERQRDQQQRPRPAANTRQQPRQQPRA